MEKDQEFLLNESSKEDSFSSFNHSSDTITFDGRMEPQTEFHIPDRYYENKIVLMAVNTQTYYVYWEMTRELINSFLDRRDSFFVYRVLNTEHAVLDEFQSNAEVGEYYLNKTYENIDIYIEVGYFSFDNTFKTILVSNTIHTFSNKLKFSDKDHEVWIKKERGWTEVIRSTLTHFTLGFSSAQYVEEIERLKEFEKTSLNTSSSATKAKGE